MKLKVPVGRIRLPSIGKDSFIGSILRSLKRLATAILGFLAVFLFILSLTHLAAYALESSSGDIVFVDWTMSVVLPFFLSIASLVLYGLVNLDRIWGKLSGRKRVACALFRSPRVMLSMPGISS